MADEHILRPFFTWRSAMASKFGPPSSTTRLVLLTLSLHMSEQGDSCFPGIDRLVDESGLSKKSVIDHIQIAEEMGWITKQERHLRSGQGWRRMEYFATIPDGIEAKIKAEKGGEPRSPPTQKGGERPSKGGERHGEKVVNDVHLSTSVNSSRVNGGGKNPPQSQTPTPPANPCQRCNGPMSDRTLTCNKWVCQVCREDYMAGKWGQPQVAHA